MIMPPGLANMYGRIAASDVFWQFAKVRFIEVFGLVVVTFSLQPALTAPPSNRWALYTTGSGEVFLRDVPDCAQPVVARGDVEALHEIDNSVGGKRLQCRVADAGSIQLDGKRLVRINTLFPHSEKYGPPWVLPVIPFPVASSTS